MSWEALNWAALQITPDKNTKALLLALANVSDHAGYCFPSIAYLSGLLQCSERTVQRGLKVLVDYGFVSRSERTGKNGARQTDDYRLLGSFPEKGKRPPGARVSPPPGDKLSPSPGAKRVAVVTPPVPPSHPPGDNCVTPIEVSANDLSNNLRRAPGDTGAAAGQEPEASNAGAAEAQRFWDERARMLSDGLGKSAYRSWISQLHPIALSASRIVLQAPTGFHRDQVVQRLSGDLSGLPKLLGRDVEITVERVN